MDLLDRSTLSYLEFMTSKKNTAGIVLLSLMIFSSSAIEAQQSKHSKVAFTHVLPQLDGTRLKATVVEVTYEPGGSSAPHSHPCPVIGYVLEGAVRMQVAGQPGAIYKAGETFYEAPNGIHQVSANASRDAPAKFLAYFVCDHETELSVALNRKGEKK